MVMLQSFQTERKFGRPVLGALPEFRNTVQQFRSKGPLLWALLAGFQPQNNTPPKCTLLAPPACTWSALNLQWLPDHRYVHTSALCPAKHREFNCTRQVGKVLGQLLILKTKPQYMQFLCTGNLVEGLWLHRLRFERSGLRHVQLGV